MTDAIPSDHEAVDSYRVELAGVGRTGRSQLPLPEQTTCTADDIVELSVGGERLYAAVETTLDDELVIRGAYANRRLARTDAGEDLLGAWLDEQAYGPGSTLVFDVVTEGYAYGLREPGSREVYEAADPPDSSLADIARSLDE